jgi:hypothetical protein
MNENIFELDRSQHGSPISRQRIFIVLVKNELMLGYVKGNLQRFGEAVKESLRIAKPDVTWQLAIMHRFNVCCSMC